MAFETAIQLDPSLNPAKPGFFEHIYPILERISINQWVNAGVALAYGWGTPADFTNPEFILVGRRFDRAALHLSMQMLAKPEA